MAAIMAIPICAIAVLGRKTMPIEQQNLFGGQA
jgi:hypothetical protein